MVYDDDDALPHDNHGTFDDDEDEQQPKKAKHPKQSSEGEEYVGLRRGYTSKERDMIAEWLKNNQPKTDESSSK